MFDPFKDFETAGYLRNQFAEKDLHIVQELEHQMFRASLDDAIAHLAKRRGALRYDDFLAVHRILFEGVYPWAGQDRAVTAPDIAVTKAGTWFCHPAHAQLAVQQGLRIGSDKRQMRQRPGEVMGLFAYGHPFLDGNGRTMLVVHTELCHRAGFCIEWHRTHREQRQRGGIAGVVRAQPTSAILSPLHSLLSPPTVSMRPLLSDWFPLLAQLRQTPRAHALADLTAAAVVTLLLIPQSMAYALLAGMPAVTGLYASVLPLVVYALMGSSTVLAPGPAALRSIMSVAAVGAVVPLGHANFVAATLALAVLVGVFLLVMGALRMGFVAGFLSHPVLSGFVTASGLLIAMSQLPHVLGTPLASANVGVFVISLWQHLGDLHPLTLAVGAGAALALWLGKRWLKPGLRALGVPSGVADTAAKAAPLLVMVLFIALSAQLGWAASGVAVVGAVPSGLPPFTLGTVLGVGLGTWQALLVPALLIAVLTFVEQVSIAQSMAAKRRERIDTNAEMRAMGGANLAAGLTGGFAVGASFSRTVVQAEAGARSPLVNVFTAGFLLLTALFFTPWLQALPLAVLAATILMAIGSLLDFGSFAKTWRYSRADFAAQALTFGVTLGVDLVSGLMAGVVASLMLHIWHSSRPHIATVGNVPGTEHYRNVLRHSVVTHPQVLSLRPDESLFFANARFLEDHVAAAVAAQPPVRHVVLQCTAVNDIDASGLQSLETIAQRLSDQGIALHLSEVKGPVMDRLQHTDFVRQLSGQVFLTHHQAVVALTGGPPH